jgi:hypothetical protein
MATWRRKKTTQTPGNVMQEILIGDGQRSRRKPARIHLHHHRQCANARRRICLLLGERWRTRIQDCRHDHRTSSGSESAGQLSGRSRDAAAVCRQSDRARQRSRRNLRNRRRNHRLFQRNDGRFHQPAHSAQSRPTSLFGVERDAFADRCLRGKKANAAERTLVRC